MNATLVAAPGPLARGGGRGDVQRLDAAAQRLRRSLEFEVGQAVLEPGNRSGAIRIDGPVEDRISGGIGAGPESQASRGLDRDAEIGLDGKR